MINRSIMNKLFSAALLSLAFASCQSSGDRVPTAPTTAAPSTIALPSTQVTDSNKQGNITSTPAAASNAGAVALNPEHGAPGHRCEIPVGAPLNSAAGSAPVSAPASTAAPMMIKPQTPAQPANKINVNSNARLNPAHGQPGHDCSIPVGQPL